MATHAPWDAVHLVEDFGQLDPAWAGTRADWIEVAGTRTRLLRHQGAAGGPTVLLVHGLGGSALNWLEVIGPLSALGDVVAVDLPGFGEAEPARESAPRPASNARFVARLIQQLDAGPVVLVGNSMGGLVATLVAGEDPDLVRELVLLCPALPPWLPSVRPSGLQLRSFGPFLLPGIGPWLLRQRARRLSFEEQYHEMMDGIVADPDAIPDRVVRIGTANLARVRQLKWRGSAFREATSALFNHQAGLARARTVAAMEGVEAPTLYVRGAEDPLVLGATTSMVRRLRPDWVVEEPAGIGHVPMIEDPDWTARSITEFVHSASAIRQPAP